MIQLLLLQHPAILARLRAELDALCPRSLHSELDDRVLTNASYLNAVILEMLRLHPLLQSGSERVVGPAGLALPGDIFLLPGTTVVVPHYALHHRQACATARDRG